MAELFKKVLSNTDVQFRLAIPMKFLLAFKIPAGQFSRQIELVIWSNFNVDGKVWSCTCCIRKKDFHPKPVISGGWTTFVQENNIQIGDQVIFYEDGDGTDGLRFRVEIQRTSKLKGMGKSELFRKVLSEADIQLSLAIPIPETELFTKVLLEADVQHSLAFPTDCLRAFQFSEAQYIKCIEVVSGDGVVWSCKCCERENDEYPISVISNGWTDFVQAKRLKEGDRVTFYNMENDGETMRLRVQGQRSWSLFGNHHWLDIEMFDS